MNTNTATHTASSLYGKVLEVTISETGQVRTTTGAFLGDVAGMTQVGWDFS